jgi:hypothetical protein
MKKLTLLIAAVFAASTASAFDVKGKMDKAKSDAKDKADQKKAEAKDKADQKAKQTQAEAQDKAKAKAGVKTHEVDAEIVAVDAAKKTITIKTDTGESTTALEGPAIAEAKVLRAGQKVTVVCREGESGELKGVVGIKLKK